VKEDNTPSTSATTPSTIISAAPLVSERVKQRAAARRREQLTYQASAVAASLGVGALAVVATWYRFAMHTQDGADYPWWADGVLRCTGCSFQVSSTRFCDHHHSNLQPLTDHPCHLPPPPLPPQKKIENRLDMGCTLALVIGGAVGMEMYARWAHKALWHDFAPGWALHRSHHEPRTGPFEVRRWLLVGVLVANWRVGCIGSRLMSSLPSEFRRVAA